MIKQDWLTPTERRELAEDQARLEQMQARDAAKSVIRHLEAPSNNPNNKKPDADAVLRALADEYIVRSSHTSPAPAKAEAPSSDEDDDIFEEIPRQGFGPKRYRRVKQTQEEWL